MGQPDNTKIVLGVAATAAVVAVSYLLAKKFGIRGSYGRRRSSIKAKEIFISSGKEDSQLNPHDVSESESQTTEPLFITVMGEQIAAGLGVEGIGTIKEESSLLSGTGTGTDEEERNDNYADNGQNQTSFIVLDNGEGVMPPDNGQTGKKSDRSSDESSYDVIDDDRLAESVGDEEEGARDKDEQGADNGAGAESFMDPNETSMVVIEDSSMSKSGSSFYVSADEISGSPGKAGKAGGGDGDVSVTEEEKTVMYTGAAGTEDDTEKQEEEEIVDVKAKAGGEAGRFQAVATSQVLGVTAEDSDSNNSSSPEKKRVVPITQAVLKAELHPASVAPTQLGSGEEGKPETEKELTAAEMTEVLETCQNAPVNVSQEQIGKLVILLRKNIPELHSTVLNSLVRVTAFTKNIDPLRELGCPQIISNQVRERCKAAGEGQSDVEVTLIALSQVLTNLTLEPKTLEELQDTIPVLIDLVISNSTSETLKQAVFRPLINFSTPTTFHGQYTRLIQTLYGHLDTGTQMIKVQSLKILVNLSLNSDMVPHLLAAKAPSTLVDMLEETAPTELILRIVTMLANIFAAVHEGKVSPDNLPVEAKAASPETMYMALNGVDRVPILRNKVFRLTRHGNGDVCGQATRLYGFVTEQKD